MKLKYYTIKLPHNSLISHASKVMLKILQARLQQCVNHELPDVQLDLEKAEEPEATDFDCVDHNKLWKILKEMGIPDHLTCLLSELRELVMDREAWHAAIHGVAKSWTRLRDWTEHDSYPRPSLDLLNQN